MTVSQETFVLIFFIAITRVLTVLRLVTFSLCSPLQVGGWCIITAQHYKSQCLDPDPRAVINYRLGDCLITSSQYWNLIRNIKQMQPTQSISKCANTREHLWDVFQSWALPMLMTKCCCDKPQVPLMTACHPADVSWPGSVLWFRDNIPRANNHQLNQIII